MDEESKITFSRSPVSETPFEEDRIEEEAQRALKDRPKISIRLRITFSFMILFILLCGMAIATIIFISLLTNKQQFLELTSNYRFEIQQARRYEKNFFLYGTNLYDALTNVQAAHNILRVNNNDIISIIGADAFETMEQGLSNYENSLNRLVNFKKVSGVDSSPETIELEQQLRQYGAEIIASASAAIDKERMEMHRLISTAKIVVIVSLIYILILIAYIVHMLTRQILLPINRAVDYTQKIAKGDFTPIRPRRKYRDEFSNLAIAINRMSHEIRVRQVQLTQSRKMAAIGNLTAGIAHELNNPLNNISLTTEALLEGFEEYSIPEKLEMLNDIFTQVERASGTVRNLLDFTRTEQPTFKSIAIGDIINSTIRLLANEMTLNDIELKLNIKQNLPPVLGNDRNLQQVFLNLLLNSIQALPDGGAVNIEAALDEDHYIRIDVSDTGYGIPPENLEKIFDPFFTTKEVGKGTGLGLSVTYGIIENHKGRITVKSQVGKGTTFSVFLPYQVESP